MLVFVRNPDFETVWRISIKLMPGFLTKKVIMFLEKLRFQKKKSGTVTFLVDSRFLFCIRFFRNDHRSRLVGLRHHVTTQSCATIEVALCWLTYVPERRGSLPPNRRDLPFLVFEICFDFYPGHGVVHQFALSLTKKENFGFGVRYK